MEGTNDFVKHFTTMHHKILPGILPLLTCEEALETSKVFSAAGLLNNQPLMVQRPFRAPQHAISDAGLIGGGHIRRPGEVSLAHNGVIFLDEFTEFRRNILDLLRQPLEDGQVTIARAAISLTYPACFMVAAAMNPSRCGYCGSHERPCNCGTHRCSATGAASRDPSWTASIYTSKCRRCAMRICARSSPLSPQQRSAST